MASMNTARLGRLVRDTRGSEVVEFALVLPVLLLVVAGIIDMGVLFNNYQVVTNAAREGARLAAIPASSEEAVKVAVEHRVDDYIAGAGLDKALATTTIEPDQLEVGTRKINLKRVVVSYQYTYLILGPIAHLFDQDSAFDTITLTGVATMRQELAAEGAGL
jgi:Flp pilus assembly protein TadG